jgi:hypothetical protein
MGAMGAMGAMTRSCDAVMREAIALGRARMARRATAIRDETARKIE